MILDMQKDLEGKMRSVLWLSLQWTRHELDLEDFTFDISHALGDILAVSKEESVCAAITGS